MAASKSAGTKGGVVNLQDVIDQIVSVTSGLEKVVDVILAQSSNKLKSKATLAKQQFNSIGMLMADLLKSIELCINDIVEEIDIDKLKDNINKIIASPEDLIKLSEAQGKDAVLGMSKDKNPGLLNLVVGLSFGLGLLGKMELPNLFALVITLKKMVLCLKMVGWVIPDIITELNNINTVSNNITIGKFEEVLSALNLVYQFLDIKVPGPISLYISILKIKMSLKMIANSMPDIVAELNNINTVSNNITIGKFEEVLSALNLVYQFLDIKVPGPISLYISILKMKFALGIIAKATPDIVAKLNTIGESASKVKTDLLVSAVYLLLNVTTIVHYISEIKLPPSFMIKMKMKRIHKALSIIRSNIGRILREIRAINYKVKRSGSISGMSKTINTLRLIGIFVGQVASIYSMIAMPMVFIGMIAVPIVLGFRIMALTLKIILISIHTIGSPQMYRYTSMILISIRRVLRKILRCVIIIAETVAAIALVIILCAMVGRMMPKIFLSFMWGLMITAMMFGLIVLSLNILHKTTREAARRSVLILRNVLIMSVSFMILALTVYILVSAAEKIQGNLLGVIEVLGVMGLVLLALVGFLTIAGALSPLITMGAIVMPIIIMGLMMVIVLVGVLWLISFLCSGIDVVAIETAVDNVIDAVSYTIRALLDADFNFDRKKQDGGILGGVLGFIGGSMYEGIFDLICKVTIVFLALIALSLILVLTLVLMNISELYKSHTQEINKAPKNVKVVLDKAAECIQAVLNANIGSKMTEGDGVFMQLIKWAFGQDMAAIIKIAMRVIIVFMTIVMMSLICLLIREMVWLSEYYKDHKDAVDAAPEKCAVVIEAASACIQAVVDARIGSAWQGGDGAFMALVKWAFGNELGTIIELLFKVIIIAMAMIVLGMLAALLKVMKSVAVYYKTLGGDTMVNNVKKMTTNIIQAVNVIIDQLSQAGDEPEGKERSGLDKLLKFIGLSKLAEIVKLLCGFIFIGLAIMALGCLVSLARTMGEAWSTYQKMGGEQLPSNARKMVRSLVAGANAMIDELKHAKIDFGNADTSHMDNLEVALAKSIELIFGSGITGIIDVLAQSELVADATNVCAQAISMGRVMDYTFDNLNKVLSKITSMPQNINKMSEVLQQMVEEINTGAENIKNQDNLNANLMKIENTMNAIAATFNRLLDVDGNKSLFNRLLTKASTYAKVVTQTDKLINSVNGLDLNKMNSLAKMFGNAAAFSQSINGNFDKLADIINEKIAPLIESLTKAIEEADKHIQNAATKAETANRQVMEAASKAAAASAMEANKPSTSDKHSNGNGGGQPQTKSGGSGNHKGLSPIQAYQRDGFFYYKPVR